jgi:hypothetical protein
MIVSAPIFVNFVTVTILQGKTNPVITRAVSKWGRKEERERERGRTGDRPV